MIAAECFARLIPFGTQVNIKKACGSAQGLYGVIGLGEGLLDQSVAQVASPNWRLNRSLLNRMGRAKRNPSMAG
ncbi:FAD/FMN-dependent dehydrogenase [Methylocaldum marinum]|uniref:FAD/FMN-dependent dehydrogenase n=1 Tax=Methylocaldum marinum TaxID=1432792 RepID=A0A250KZ68_9GAMM|nr:FAD/FMN-dependent dehydrogenase [Methylocaldum marinum]